jgi:hypothetical protein
MSRARRAQPLLTIKRRERERVESVSRLSRKKVSIERGRKAILPFSVNDAAARSLELHLLVDHFVTVVVFLIHFSAEATKRSCNSKERL